MKRFISTIALATLVGVPLLSLSAAPVVAAPVPTQQRGGVLDECGVGAVMLGIGAVTNPVLAIAGMVLMADGCKGLL